MHGIKRSNSSSGYVGIQNITLSSIQSSMVPRCCFIETKSNHKSRIAAEPCHNKPYNQYSEFFRLTREAIGVD